MKTYHYLILVGILAILSSIAFGVAAQEPEEDPLGVPPTFLHDIWEAWSASPHARFEDEAFQHWNEDGEVSDSCARCHSTPGYQDYLGADGTEAGIVDGPAALGTVINCDACHSEAATNLTSVTFPSGVELTDLNDAARCMVCHQGRASVNTVNDAIANSGVGEDLNAVSENLRFINIHYYAAAASLYGSEVHGGYEYDGLAYQSRFRHVEEFNTCIDCHDQHTLELQVEECTACHLDVAALEDVYDIRMPGSGIDYDGDGDVEEGIKAEIETLQEILYATMQAYAADVAGTPVVYDSHSYPYFFIDANADGAKDDGDTEGYNGWTGRLVQAAYNYQVTQKDPGGFAHNAKYHIELLVDSINALNDEMGGTMDTSQLNRDDPGHFNTTLEAFRHWDADGAVDAGCSKCHSADGLPFFIENGTFIDQPIADSLNCTTCHSSMGDEFAVYTTDEVTMPSGAVVSFGEEEPSNICLNCHQGRASTVSVNQALNRIETGPDEVSDAARLTNPHYFAAGATKFGTEAQGGYQFDGKDYSGYFEHNRRYGTCVDCHDQHTLEPRVEECADCHENVETKDDIYMIRVDDFDDPVDYDGDGNDTEPIKDEIGALHEALFAAIQDYAVNTAGGAIVYDGHSYPYWFNDLNENGVADEDEVNRDNSYSYATPNLVRAVYNYLFIAKDPGSFAHNADYSIQLLYDSIEALGGDVSGFNRAPIIE